MAALMAAAGYREVVAILAADVVGFSAAMEQNQTDTIERLQNVETNIIEKCIVEGNGRLFKRLGDGFMAEFADVADALRSAVCIQNAMAQLSRPLDQAKRTQLRIGLNVGDAIAIRDDMFGHVVNVAARVQELATPGGIVVTKAVRHKLRGNPAFLFRPIGLKKLKNLERLVELYSVSMKRQDDVASSTGTDEHFDIEAEGYGPFGLPAAGPSSEFSERPVCFVDLLGFSSAVLAAERGDGEIMSRVIGVLREFRGVEREVWSYGESGAMHQMMNRVAIFSDNVFLSGDIGWIISSARFLALMAISHGFLVRGGLTIGSIYHSREIVVGPALTEAYLLESKVADSARIVATEKLYQFVGDVRPDLAKLLVKDDDGMWKLDFLAPIEKNADDDYDEFLGKITRWVMETTGSGRLERMETQVSRKFHLFARYFNDTAERFGSSQRLELKKEAQRS
jgi:class 3 adenylate cyclase